MEKSKLMRRILLRVDDLGYSRAVNYGILDCVERGLVNNVGIMTNMESTAEAVEWLKDKEIDLGVHINLTNGRPLSASSKVPALVDEKGEFHRSSLYRENMAKGNELLQTEQAVTEIEAQYLQFVKLTGRQPDYFEGHAISSNNFRTALEFVTDKYNLSYLELPKTTEMLSPFKKNTLFHFVMGGYVNGKLDSDYDPLNLLRECIEHSADAAIPMIVSHAGYLDDYLLKTSSLTFSRVKEAAAWMSLEAKNLVQKSQVKLIRYSECS